MNVVGGAVVLHDAGVIDRDVGGPLVEVLDRVTAFAHYLGHQLVRLH